MIFFKTIEHPEVTSTLASIAKQWSKQGLHQKAMDQFQIVLRILITPILKNILKFNNKIPKKGLD